MPKEYSTFIDEACDIEESFKKVGIEQKTGNVFELIDILIVLHAIPGKDQQYYGISKRIHNYYRIKEIYYELAKNRTLTKIVSS